MLNKREFEILAWLARKAQPHSQRELAEAVGFSLGSVNKTVQSLIQAGYLENGLITAGGIAALEPYRVKRAVFMAAGFGPRMIPVTLNTPKPLVRVHGKRIIDTLLDAVAAAGIEEIIIVRGYLGEQFDQLLYEYPNIKFVDNPLFNEANNIASAISVRHLLKNAYVLDSDLLLSNPAMIRPYEYQTNLLGIPVARTDDWCVTTGRNGFAENLSVGGVDAYREVGITYISAEDGAKLEQDLLDVYHSPGGKERFWEETMLVYKKDHYHVALRECTAGDVTELDTFSELKALDQSYL